MRSTKKSQAALEYLLVYGAAIVIVLIAVAYLYVLFYSPQTKIPNTCTFSGGATCADLVLGINAVTSNTAILLLLNNAGDSYIQNPMAKASIIGVNTSWFGCIPSSVEEGGSIVCLINLTKKYGVGQAVSGTVFLSEQNCAFSSLGGCQNPVNQIYAGTFYGTTEIAGPPIFKVTVSQQTAQGLGSMVPIIAYVTLNGFPLKGITVNFTSNTPSVTPTPHYVSTDSSGQATTYISHTLPGGTAIYANVSNTIASKVAGTTSTSTSSTSTSTSTSSTTSTSTSTTSTSTLHYLSFTVTNPSSSAAVQSGFQQQITFNPSSYAGNEISNLGNIRFYQGTTEMYSWCESGCLSSSSEAVFWVVLGSGIAANSNIAVNAIFTTDSNYATDIGTNGPYAGECPLCSSAYGTYDNGLSVFSFYQNFAGKSLPAGWAGQGSTTYSVNNGITMSAGTMATSGPVFYSENNIIEALMTTTDPGGCNVGCFGETNKGYVSGGNGNGAAAIFIYGSGSVFYAADGKSNSYDITSGSPFYSLSTATPYLIGFTVTPTNVYGYVNYVLKITGTGTFNTAQYIFVGDQHGGGNSYSSYPLTFTYVRVRQYPLNGMPSVTLNGFT